MTCIAGIVTEDGTIHMGADSAGVAGFDLTVRSDEKVFVIGPDTRRMLVGFTTSFRMGQVLRYRLAVPPCEDDDLMRWMVTVFVDAVRDALKAAGWAEKDKEQERGGSFLVGFRGRLFEIGSDYQVGEPLDRIAAVGCGAQVALGALWGTQDHAPGARIHLALEAAERFSAGVRAPFHVLSLPR